MTHHTKSAAFVVGMDPEAAFSVFYEDGNGRLLFVFDVDKDPKKIRLDVRPLQGGRLLDAADDATKAWANLALDRVKAHLEGLGLAVEVD
jgi:hypothetical protein